jgi:hypothetical protein
MVEPFLDFVLARASTVVQDAQLEGILIETRKTPRPDRPDYFYLRDLVNPQQAYWEHCGSTAPKSRELRAAFAFGNRMHDVAGRVFAGQRGFAGTEAILDGAGVGIDGVRGRIDLRIGESLVEFKTTSKSVDTGQDVWANVPQDIEQLLFYAALWSHRPEKHLLVFRTPSPQAPLRIFEVRIDDYGAVANHLKQRRRALRRALEDHDPQSLRRCRYFDSHCPQRDAGECACASLEQINTEPIAGNCSLSRNTNLEAELLRDWVAAERQPRSVSAWELAVPRRAFLRLKGIVSDEEWAPDDEGWIWGSLARAGLLPGPLEPLPSTRLTTPLPFKASGGFLKRRVSRGEAGAVILTPYNIRPWEKSGIPTAFAIRPQIAQLGVLCALSGRPTGLAFLEIRNSDAQVAAFQVEFENLDDIRRAVTDTLRSLAEAVAANTADSLPQCPKFVQGYECPHCLCR